MVRGRHSGGAVLRGVVPGLVLLCAAGCGTRAPDPRADVHDLAGVPLSEELRPAVEGEVQALRAAAYRTAPEGVAAYDALEPRIDRTASRAEAADELHARWRAEPGSYPWLNLIFRNRHLLRGHLDLDEVRAHPAYRDTTRGAGAFMRGQDLFNLGGRGRQYLDMDPEAEDPDGVNRVWLVLERAYALSQKGEFEEAARSLLAELPRARVVGGARLAARTWRALAFVLRRGDRLDDALHAQVLQVALWRAVGAEYQELQARAGLANLLHERNELGGAFDLIEACIEEARARDHPWLLTRALNRAAGYYAAAGDLERALRVDLQSVEHARALRDSFNVPVALTNVAYDLRLLGRLREARAYLDEGRRWVEAYPDPRLRAGFPLREVPYYLHVGDYATADSLLQVVMGSLPAVSIATEEAEFHLEQIDFARDLGRADLAYRSIARLEELRYALKDKLADSNRVAEYAMATAELLARQGEYRRAAGALEDAAVAVERGGGEGMDWKLARARGELALLRGDTLGARRAFARSLELAEAGSEPAKLAESRFLLGTALIEAGRPREAVPLLEPAGEAPPFGSRFRVRLSSLLYAAIARARDGQTPAAVAGFRRVLLQCTPHTPPDLRVRLHLELGRALDTLGDTAQARSNLQEAARVLRESDARTFAAELRLPNRRLRRDLVEALVGFELDHDADGGPELARRTLAARALLDGDEGDDGRWPSLWFFVGKERSFRWLRGAAGLTVSELPGAVALERAVAPVVVDVQRPDRAPDRAALRRLSDLLVGSLAAAWPAGRTLALRPDGVLQAVPWSLLPLTTAGGGTATLLDRGPLCEQPPVPGARTARSPASARLGLLALGDDRPLDTEGADGALRHAEAEASAVAELWPGTLVDLRLGAAGDGLTESDLVGHDVIHVASHARLSEGLAQRATLRLAAATAPLTAAGVGRVRLDAELIYLSCCEADRPLAAGGVASFARACLAAGAGTVIASGQRVDDESAAALARRFYRHWLAGEAKAAALRAAQLEVRDARADWAHPYYWAGYRLIGDPR